MADDNEFLSRKERDERIKNIEYQIEDERTAVAERQQKEKTRRERTRKKEAQKEQARIENAEKQAKAAEAEQLEKKKQQQEAREIMEKQRQAKTPNGKASVTKTSTNEQIKNSAASVLASNLARDNVSTELYVDGKKISEKDLPQDLVKQIRQEQAKAVRQTENEIREANSGINNNISEGTDGVQDKVGRDILNNKLKNYGGRYTSSSGSSGENGVRSAGNGTGLGLSGSSAFGVDVKNSKPTEIASGKYGSSAKGSSKVLNNNNNPMAGESTKSPLDPSNSNSGENYVLPQGYGIGNRDALKADLSKLNGANLGNIGKNNYQDSNNRTPKHRNSASDTGIFMGAGAGMAAGASRPPKNRMNTPRKTTAAQGGGTTTDGSDLDAQLSNRMAANARKIGNMAGRAYRGAKNAAKAMRTAMKTKKFLALGSLIGIFGIIILILILVVGAISFIMNMPGMVRDKLVDIWDSFWQGAKGLVVGQDKPTGTAIKNMAEYLESMGYDLEYNGFVTKLEKDKDGNIKDIESKYLAAYIAAEQRSYLIANENYNVIGIYEGFKSLLPGNVTKENWGTGMIVLERSAFESIAKGLGFDSGVWALLASVGENLSDYFLSGGGDRGAAVKNASALTSRVIIKRDTKEMIISKVNIVDAWNTGGYDVYRYSLKEWTEKYGTPTELFLTLHLATRAPEFAYNFATTYDTKVYINIKELTDVDITLVYAKTDQDGKIVLDDNGKPIMIPISEMSDAEIKAKGITNEALAEMRNVRSKVTAFTPYITKVINHWYYQQIIYQGEYKEKDIDVYKIQSLAEGDDGYVRYYAYTVRDNSDAGAIESDSEKVELAGNSTLWGIYNVIAKVVATVMTGGYAGISGLIESASEAALNEAYGMLKDAVVDEISSQIKNMLPDQLASMLNVNDFLKGNLSLSQLQELKLDGINLSNMTEFLDFDKISGYLSIDNLKLDVNKMWDQLNIKDELLNMDLAGLGSINDLQDVITNMDLSNINDVFSDKFGEMVDLSNVNFDKLTNQLVGGFSSSIEDIQKSIVNSCDALFSGLSEADFNKISDRMLGDITKQLSDLSSGQIIDQLSGSIQKTVEGKFNGEILSGLQNEFSKQLTGLSYKDLGKLSNIQGMDFNQLKNLSGQVTNVSSALKGADISINNLTANVNKISKDITGMDARVLSSVSTSLTNFDTTINTSKLETQVTRTLLRSLNTSTSDINALNNKIETLENKLEQLQSANNQLDIERMNVLQNEIDACKRDIVNTANKLDNLDEQALRKVQTQVAKLENNTTKLVDNITSLDAQRIGALKYRIKDLDKTGLVELATNLNKLDVANNGMDELVQKYGTDLTDLKTSEINTIMNTINGQNTSAQGAIKGISKYLMKADETELASNLNKLNSTINLLSNATDNLDVNKVALLVNKVPGFDSLHLNNIASQISGLENVSIDQLLRKVEELPNKIVDQVSRALTQKITEGVKDQISQNLSEKLKSNMLNSGTFSGDLKTAMTSGEKQDIDMETEDDAIEKPFAEYSTGFYVREIRHSDYFQKAEPLRVLYSPTHWLKMFRQDKYVILDTPSTDMSKVDDKEYIEKYGKTIWEATDGNIESGIYAMLQGIQSSESQYLFRYFKELFNDMSWVFDGNYGFSNPIKPGAVNPNTISWIFRTVKVEEPDFVGNSIEFKSEKIVIKKEELPQIDNIIKARKPAGTDYYEYEYKEVLAHDTVEVTEKKACGYATLRIKKDELSKIEEIIKSKMPSGAETYTYTISEVLTDGTVDRVVDIETDQDAIDMVEEAANSGNSLTEYELKITYYRMEKVQVEAGGLADDIGSIETDQDAVDIGKDKVESGESTTSYDVTIKYYKYEGEKTHMVQKAEYEPYTWSASKVGILNPKSIDPVYGFKAGIDIVAPANGVVVAKTEAKINELGQKVAQSVTIELRDTGDANADGMRIILIGGDYSTLMVGSLVSKETYSVDEDRNYTGGTERSIIGKTTEETIKIMVLDKDQTPVNDVSEYIYPPYEHEKYKPRVGDEDNERK